MDKLLPGFQEAIKDIQSRGYKADWVLKNADKAKAHFIPNGKKFKSYSSECPYYVGYWLDAPHSSVECSCSSELIPCLQHHLFCSKDYEKCIFYERENEKLNCFQNGKS